MKRLPQIIALCCSLFPAAVAVQAQDAQVREQQAQPVGDPARGRLVFGPCRTCHYPERSMGHNNGPNLHRIFGKVAGKQEGFAYYSEEFKAAQFVWTPELMFTWLENPMAMPDDATPDEIDGLVNELNSSRPPRDPLGDAPLLPG